MLQQAYEVFQNNVGLQGNIFTQTFMDLLHLLVNNWFFDLWWLSDHFKVLLVVHELNNVLLIHVDDCLLMECFVALWLFLNKQLGVLVCF